MPCATCEGFLLFRLCARVGCRRGLLWERPFAPARRCFVRCRCHGRYHDCKPCSASGNPLPLALLLPFLLLRCALLLVLLLFFEALRLALLLLFMLLCRALLLLFLLLRRTMLLLV